MLTHASHTHVCIHEQDKQKHFQLIVVIGLTSVLCLRFLVEVLEYFVSIKGHCSTMFSEVNMSTWYFSLWPLYSDFCTNQKSKFIDENRNEWTNLMPNTIAHILMRMFDTPKKHHVFIRRANGFKAKGEHFFAAVCVLLCYMLQSLFADGTYFCLITCDKYHRPATRSLLILLRKKFDKNIFATSKLNIRAVNE